MGDVNWWLMAIAFVLGVALTLAFTLRRVTREVPVYEGAGVATLAGGATAVKAKTVETKVPAPEPDEASTSKIAALKGDAGDSPTEVIRTSDLDSPTAVIKTSEVDAATAVVRKPAKKTPVQDAPPAVEGDDSPTSVIAVGAGGAAGGAVAAGLLGGAGDSDDAPVEKEELPPGPHGAGTAAPKDDGSGPIGWDIKGNEDSMLYHTTESPYYGRTIAEVWFRDVESAEAAGFNRWDSGKSQRGRK